MSEAPPIAYGRHRSYSWDRPPMPALAEAYLSCFSTPAGQIVLEDLEFRTLYTRVVDERGLGRMDLMHEILLILHEAYEAQTGGRPHGRTE